MEVALLQLYHFRLKAYNFPQVRDLAFQRRVHTGAGRYTYMSHGGEIDLPDAYLDHDFQIDLDNLEAGVCVACSIEGRKLRYLELVVNGNENWDGTEPGWRLLDGR